MLIRSEPSEATVRSFLDAQATQPFSYSEVGATRHGAPPGYAVNRFRILLGSGAATFERAVMALRQWKMFDLPWIKLYWPDTPIEPGATVAIAAHTYGVWSLSACKIIYLIDEHGAVERHGFGYGTLPDHVARGEERFMIERTQDDRVWYELFSFSRPAHPLVKFAPLMARLAQRRFARESAQLLAQAVNQG